MKLFIVQLDYLFAIKIISQKHILHRRNARDAPYLPPKIKLRMFVGDYQEGYPWHNYLGMASSKLLVKLFSTRVIKSYNSL